MKLFSRHVSREVAETIWREREEFLEGGRLRSQALVVTALFTDLTGFTPVAEKLGPAGLMEWLNEYMDAMARRGSEHGGGVPADAGGAQRGLLRGSGGPPAGGRGARGARQGGRGGPGQGGT